jgi:16S rRNA (cytosine1402-N4)-methyltransferase
MSDSPRETGNPVPSVHAPVLLREVIKYLDLAPEMIVVDGTVGAGGHSRAILDRLGPSGRLIGLDRDPMMLRLAEQKLSDPRATLHCSSYLGICEILSNIGITSVDCVLLDLGLSSDQLADRERGFGIRAGGPLDLRFNPEATPRSAADVLNTLADNELEGFTFGEERFSGPIASAIVARRSSRPIQTAEDLVETIASAVPAAFQRNARVHPATRIFQALRIFVNEELSHLTLALANEIPAVLKPGGRAVVITFHSLEDRIVKDSFRDKTQWENLTSKPVTASPAEARLNPRSRTAKIRAAKRK